MVPRLGITVLDFQKFMSVFLILKVSLKSLKMFVECLRLHFSLRSTLTKFRQIVGRYQDFPFCLLFEKKSFCFFIQSTFLSWKVSGSSLFYSWQMIPKKFEKNSSCALVVVTSRKTFLFCYQNKVKVKWEYEITSWFVFKCCVKQQITNFYRWNITKSFV